MTQMKTLGRRIGELHAVLSKESADSAFDPEPIGTQDLSRWRAKIAEEADESFKLLGERLASLSDGAQDCAKRLLDARQRLLECLDRLTPKTLQATKTRFHGDLHLGQVLLVADDFLITDFEGEPSRPITERRQKSSVLRDVAGMLRSFDYARAVALERALTARPDLRERVEPAFEEWRRDSSIAFLDGYYLGVGAASCIPTERDAARKMISLFELEKALYELRYELNNRPSWAGIPLAALLALCAA
jgi:maltose alpha-D-glucosyltransferase/alpha-amylase